MNDSEYDEYELVRKDRKVIANYPKDELKKLTSRFKEICKTPEFEDYDSLVDFIESIYFLEFLEYFLDYLHFFFPDVISYKKDKSKMTKDELFIITTASFGKLIHYAYRFLFFHDTLQSLLYGINFEYKKLEDSKIFSQKEKLLLIELYTGFIYFLELLTRNGKLYKGMKLLTDLKDHVMKGKLNGIKPMFNPSKVEIIKIFYTTQNIIFYRTDLLLKFRLFQRKYVSEIAKLRKIGSPSDSKEKSKKLKKELNKNKNINYKAYEMFCKYVLQKLENETIYDYLAGIHKNSSGKIIHKNINNETVNKIKINTKKTQHTEYVKKSEKILKEVEEKIKKYGNIIDIQTKNRVKKIRVLFNSDEFVKYKNYSSIGIGMKIIQDCKTIRRINKKIDDLIREEKERELEKQKQMLPKKKNKNDELTENEWQLLSNLSKTDLKSITDIKTLKKLVITLLFKYHQNKIPKNSPNKNKLLEISKLLGTIKNKLNSKTITEFES